MSKKENPAIMPGDGARAFDTIQDDFIKSVREFQLSEDWTGRGYCCEYMSLIAYISGYNGKFPVADAHKLATKLIKERRQF